LWETLEDGHYSLKFHFRDATKTFQGRHVCSKENPADDASRGVRFGDFMQGQLGDCRSEFLYGTEAE
jgi:uncharacterized protein YdiU (UPF0061 family)